MHEERSATAVRLTRAIEAEVGGFGSGKPLSTRVGPGEDWELLEVVKHDHNESKVAYLRSAPGEPVYVTDELDAIEVLNA